MFTPYTGWRAYRRRAWLFWAAFLGGIPYTIVGGWFTEIHGIRWVWWLLMAWWGVSFFVTALRKGMFLCPRCGQEFFSRDGFGNTFARKCLHCGLPKWAEPAASPTQPPRCAQRML
jgi:hypothetical protein